MSLTLPLPVKCLTGLSRSADPPFLFWLAVLGIHLYPECHAFLIVLFWTHKQRSELVKASSFHIYPQKGSGSKLRYSIPISSGMLASPHYLTLRCQRLWLHLVFTFGKAIHWKTSTNWAMMVGAPIEATCSCPGSDKYVAPICFSLKRFSVRSRRGREIYPH